MNMVKQEETPAVFGFSHTRLDMDRTLEKERAEQVQQEAGRH